MGNFYHNSKMNRLVVAEKTADLYLLLSVQKGEVVLAVILYGKL